jgi:glucoamylase
MIIVKLILPRFTWTRDSALSLDSMLPAILPPLYLQPWEPCSYAGTGNFNYSAHAANVYGELLIRSYIDGQARLQTLQTRSGDLWSGGLNEPKFTADGRAFDGDWGRPQR